MTDSGTSYLHGDENRQGAMLATTVAVTLLTTLVVALRMATRIWIVRNVGWDDYTIVAACLGHIVALALVVTELHYGFGRHRDYLTTHQYAEFLKFSYGEWIQTFQTLMFTKLSICLLLLRIPVDKYLIRPLRGAIAFLIVTNVILTLLWIFQCSPVAGAWDKERPAKCFTDAQLLEIILTQAVISIISDVVLALFPILILWEVQIGMRIKAGLCFLMSLGLVTAACCIVRTVINSQNITSDISWVSVTNWYWRVWEVSVGIVAASIPALRPGWRVMSSSIETYFSIRFPHTTGEDALVEAGNPSNPPSSSLHQQPRHTPHDSAVKAAAHSASIEALKAQDYGAGGEAFAMQNLAGDKETRVKGIRKTTTIDIADRRSRSSQRSFVLPELDGNGERNLSFV